MVVRMPVMVMSVMNVSSRVALIVLEAKFRTDG
jgi:hypothetical protein